MPLPASLEVYECANADACVGGSDVSSYCADGFKGPRKFMLSAAVDIVFLLSLQLFTDMECIHTLIVVAGCIRSLSQCGKFRNAGSESVNPQLPQAQ